MRVTSKLLEEMYTHALEDTPDECCGIFHGIHDEVVAVKRGTNVRPSPGFFQLDDESLMEACLLDDNGAEVGVYHSHPTHPAIPSAVDLRLCTQPSWHYIIVSLGDDVPHARCWRIEADVGRFHEEDLEIVMGDGTAYSSLWR